MRSHDVILDDVDVANSRSVSIDSIEWTPLGLARNEGSGSVDVFAIPTSRPSRARSPTNGARARDG